jgi:tetratricopeptide (TPR) repeat protein
MEALMTSEQARLFADYILSMPDRNSAIDYVRFSAFRLDDTFFEQLCELIGEARNHNDGARQQSLDWLMSLASDACGRAYAPFACAAKSKSSRQRNKAEPQTDAARAMELIQIDKRVTAMMMRTHFNPVDDTVIADWKNIVDDYRELIKAGPPKTPLYTIDNVRLKVAQSLEALARAYASLHDAKQSSAYYKQAAQAFHEAGERGEAARCRSRQREDSMAEGAEYDDQIRAALQDLENLDKKQPEYFARLVDLGELQAHAGDDFAAEKTLLEAESGLKHAKWGNPSGSDLAEALVATLTGLSSGQAVPSSRNIQTSTLVRTLHRRIHLGLADVYQSLGDTEKAGDRLERAEQMDRTSPDDDFSTTMTKLSGDWQKLFR